ncbi:MAG: zinc ribbon domain-containing protein [Calditrichia bacterium]
MPTYDYQCTSCDHLFEKFHSISFNGEILCPICNSKAERKLSSGTGLIFKGSGFYITDYNSKKGAESKSDATKDK